MKVCENKPSSVIADNLKHNKKQNKYWQFLSMSLKALAFYADVKRKVLKHRYIRLQLTKCYGNLMIYCVIRFSFARNYKFSW